MGLASTMLVNSDDGGAVNCAWLSPCFPCAPATAILCWRGKKKNPEKKQQNPKPHTQKPQLYSSLVTLTAASFLSHLW